MANDKGVVYKHAGIGYTAENYSKDAGNGEEYRTVVDMTSLTSGCSIRFSIMAVSDIRLGEFTRKESQRYWPEILSTVWARDCIKES